MIKTIKSKKEAYLKCIDVELAKNKLSEYADRKMDTYSFAPFESSLLPIVLTKLDYLKVFKEFILDNNEEILPEEIEVRAYLSPSRADD